jgi:periplasmic copper chaperone A
MRVPLPAAFGATLVALVGAAGLIRGAQPLPSSAAGIAPPAEPIVVSGAYIRANAPPTDAAAAYFTVYNTGDIPDTLQSVVSGAGASTVLHITTQGKMIVNAAGVLIPPHAKLVLKAGAGHVMIEQLFGNLTAGQNVSLELTFKNAGVIDLTAPVIALGAPPPSNGGSS